MPKRAASTSSVAEPVQRIGRECGVSPSSAPSVTTISEPVVRATATTSSQNAFHFRLGSMPSSRTRSRPEAMRVAENVSAGQFTVRNTPSISSTVGRAAWKSRYSSGSSVAIGVAPVERANHRTASVAASPASFQPWNAAMSAGRRSSGRSIQRTVTRSP